MNRQSAKERLQLLVPLLVLSVLPTSSWTQVVEPVIEEIEELPVISSSEIEELIGPIALYPDDLLAIVLPASTYPLQVVEAARFLEALETDPSLEPDPEWDDSIVALLNYPEVLEMLNEDLDWTWRLGEAVVAQQSDVIAAIELFRDRAYAAGNLESDDYQLVSHEGGSIQITPVEEDVIYVPYYEPEEVVVYQPRRVYYYYPRPYPVYYYPYPSHHVFYRDHFWGVTTAFTIGWHLHHLNVYHHSFYGHPYYGRTYWDRWWYRRPSIHIYNNYYVRNHRTHYNRYREGDRWYPNVRSTIRKSDRRVTRTRYYPGDGDTRRSRSVSTRTSFAPSRDHDRTATGRNRPSANSRGSNRGGERPEIRFRERPDNPQVNRSAATRPSADRRGSSSSSDRRSSRTGSQRTTRQPDISTRRDFAERESRATSRSSNATRSRTPTLRSSRPSEPRAGSSRPSQPRVQTTRRSEPRTESSRPSQPRAQTTRRSEPRAEASRPSQPRAQTTRRSEPRAESSRPSQPRAQSSRRSEPRAAAPRPSQPKSGSSRQSTSKGKSTRESRSSRRSESRSRR